MAMNEVWTQRREEWRPEADDARTAYEVDHGRVCHSLSFRKLAGKTQILGIGDGDFHRNRLTHSIEVGQVALGVLQRTRNREIEDGVDACLPGSMLMQTISHVHDLGHPPYGHGGEVALNGCMESVSKLGFEGNAQTLRILSRLEMFSDGAGANLTRRALLGTLKYPVAYSTAASPKPLGPNGDPLRYCTSKPPKCYMDSEQEVVDWLLAPLSEADRALVLSSRAKSLDATIMDVSDDISYGVHDLEDAIETGMDSVRLQDVREFIPAEYWRDYLDRERVRQRLRGGKEVTWKTATAALFEDSRARKKQIGRLVGYFIASVEIAERPGFEESLYRFHARMRPEATVLLERLKSFIKDRVIKSAEVQHLRLKGMNMLGRVFEILASDPGHMLPRDVQRSYRDAGDDPQIICDYVSGMTDLSLERMYGRLFIPGYGSTYDRL